MKRCFHWRKGQWLRLEQLLRVPWLKGPLCRLEVTDAFSDMMNNGFCMAWKGLGALQCTLRYPGSKRNYSHSAYSHTPDIITILLFPKFNSGQTHRIELLLQSLRLVSRYAYNHSFLPPQTEKYPFYSHI